MQVGRHTAAQLAEIQFFGVHLSPWLSEGKERVRMPRRNAPEIFFSQYGASRSCARTGPWFRGRILVHKNQPLVPRSNIAGSWTRGGGVPFVGLKKNGRHQGTEFRDINGPAHLL